MPWITFTADHVTPHLAVRELGKFEGVASAASDEEEGDPPPPLRLPGLVTQVCNRFRGEILSNPRVAGLGPDGTLPDWLIHSAALICRQSVISMIPVEEGWTDPRQSEYKDAKDTLDSLKDRDPKALDIEPPAGPVSAGGSFGGERKRCW